MNQHFKDKYNEKECGITNHAYCWHHSLQALVDDYYMYDKI